MASEWTTVPYKKRKHKRVKNMQLCNGISDDGKTYNRQSILNLAKLLLATKFCEEALKRIKEVIDAKKKLNQEFVFQEIVCYGLGRPSCTHIPAYQLCFLVILHHFLCCNNSSVENILSNLTMDIERKLCEDKIVKKQNIKCLLYDPAFTDKDKALIEDLGFISMETNELGRREAQGTLFYMIHCDKWMYNNLLWRNWSSGCLNNCMILGNSFQSMFEMTPARMLREQYKYVYLSVENSLVSEVILPDWKDHDTIFNDTAIVVFAPEFTKNFDFAVTKDKACPLYEE